MQNVLLTSSNFIKGLTNISDNISDKMLLPAIRESQEIDLKGVIGENLLDRIKELVRENEINNVENAAYKDVLEKCQYFLAYQTVARVCVMVSYKIDAIGVSRTRDDNIDYASLAEVMQMEQYYVEKADFFKLELQNFCLANRQALPELRECDCYKIHSNLYSTASSGLFLGGRRGKVLKNNGLCGKGK